MTHCVGIDVSLETSSICIVDQNGRAVRELTAETEPEALIRPARLSDSCEVAGGTAT